MLCIFLTAAATAVIGAGAQILGGILSSGIQQQQQQQQQAVGSSVVGGAHIGVGSNLVQQQQQQQQANIGSSVVSGIGGVGGVSNQIVASQQQQQQQANIGVGSAIVGGVGNGQLVAGQQPGHCSACGGFRSQSSHVSNKNTNVQSTNIKMPNVQAMINRPQRPRTQSFRSLSLGEKDAEPSPPKDDPHASTGKNNKDGYRFLFWGGGGGSPQSTHVSNTNTNVQSTNIKMPNVQALINSAQRPRIPSFRSLSLGEKEVEPSPPKDDPHVRTGKSEKGGYHVWIGNPGKAGEEGINRETGVFERHVVHGPITANVKINQ